MQGRARTAILAALCSAASLALWPACSLGADLDFIPCASERAFSCTDLAVPLDRSGKVAGTISLSVERKLAGSEPSTDAMVALAGGPGQAALPFAGFAAKSMAAGLRSRDLLVFDQRGTGDSDPLSCPALERFSSTIGRTFQQCAEEIGPARAAFTTQESVQDIEALRVAGGYEKLVLYGTSYGTKVALEYAERYPQHVEALLLDSVVPPDGPEPFAIPTFQAVPSVLAELCAEDACAGITSDPLGDVTRLIAKLRRQTLSGSVYDGLGHRHDERLDELGLLDILRAGDLNPALRALFPAAVVSALRDDPDPLLRLQALSEGLIPNVPSTAGSDEGDEGGEALFVTTTCEEAPFPWQRTASPAARLSEAIGFLRAQPASDFVPFDQSTALQQSLVEACDSWPDASPPPPAPQPLPDVPTLILSGAQDLRTPTTGAEQVAAQIPDAQVEVVPFTGHSVVGSDLTGCARKAVTAFFAGQAVAPCASGKYVLRPTPITPRRLSSIRAPAGLSGRPGQTLVAVLDTLLDLNRQIIAATLQADQALPNGASFGGLHGGYAKLTATKAVLKGLSLLPGVQLSGTFPVRKGRLETATIDISGATAAPGSVRVGGASKHVSGQLGGHDFDLDLAKVRLSQASLGEWPVAPFLFSRLGHEQKLGALVGGAWAQLP